MSLTDPPNKLLKVKKQVGAMYYELLNIKENHTDSIFYVNLTNGVEALQTMNTLGLEPRFVSIQSTKLEQKEYDSMMLELGADLLLNLAIGKICVVIDYGANKKNSRAVYKGVPLIKYICERAWFGEAEPPKILNRTDNRVKQHCDIEFDYIYNNLSKKTKRYLNKYKKYTPINKLNKVNLIGISNSTVHDGDAEYYKNRLKFYLD